MHARTAHAPCDFSRAPAVLSSPPTATPTPAPAPRPLPLSPHPDPSTPAPTHTASDIPAVARQSFPLCMLTMYGALHDSHHLKHEGRMQLGLFLKVGRLVGAGGGCWVEGRLGSGLRVGARWQRTHPAIVAACNVLQGIGLPLEEAIRFWRTEMAPVRRRQQWVGWGGAEGGAPPHHHTTTPHLLLSLSGPTLSGRFLPHLPSCA